MLDHSYHPSLHFTSPALDYEQSQNDQAVCDARKALLSPRELADRAEQCRLKRVHLGHEDPKIKQEDSSPTTAPRPTAIAASDKLMSLYAPGGFLDSQTGSQTFVDTLINYSPKTESQSQSQQEQDGLGISQESEAINNSDFELEVQVQWLRAQLEFVMKERDDLSDERNKYRQAYQELEAEHYQLHQSLGDATIGSCALADLLLPYMRQHCKIFIELPGPTLKPPHFNDQYQKLNMAADANRDNLRRLLVAVVPFLTHPPPLPPILQPLTTAELMAHISLTTGEDINRTI
ncbi:hypothetical protein C8R44DRAFT_733961 [Mycena epipterygia]|nr:hypothetical protein C8R44DRAFT_733961 [Mycena epipterygia]